MKQNTSPLSGGKVTQEKPQQYERPVPGSTLRCLDDPAYPDINSPPSAVTDIVNQAAADAEKARDRYDRLWGGSNEPQK